MNSNRYYLLLLVLCVVCPLLTAHGPLLAQPIFGEPLEDYYKAQGRGIRVKWFVPQTTVVEGHDLNVTLVIIGATNPTTVEKPDLSKIPKFAERFAITPESDEPRTPKDQDVRFNYKFRPRNRNVTQIPALKFYYYNPSAAPGKQFPYTMPDSMDITVTEPPKPPKVAMWEADHLFHVSSGPEVLHAPFVPCQWAWLAAGLFGPLAALGWFLVWRRIFPDAARMTQLRRSRAARRATDAIRSANRTPDPPATIANAVLGYLRMRFPLPESAVTPSEIATALVGVSISVDVAEQVADVFRECDRSRFAPPSDSGVSLAANAEAAITRLEAIA
jgi:hypothetical protein